MEDGPVGYVLHTEDALHFLCESDGKVRLDHPQSDDVSVLTSHARAVVLQRYWNGQVHDHEKVSVSLRREAMQVYIDRQQTAFDTLMKFVNMTK
jgi:hypothetical protein